MPDEIKRVRTCRITLNILPDVGDMLDELATDEDRSRTNVIERLIRAAYQRRKNSD